MPKAGPSWFVVVVDMLVSFFQEARDNDMWRQLGDESRNKAMRGKVRDLYDGSAEAALESCGLFKSHPQLSLISILVDISELFIFP
jgi:hypothetical protein